MNGGCFVRITRQLLRHAIMVFGRDTAIFRKGSPKSLVPIGGLKPGSRASEPELSGTTLPTRPSLLVAPAARCREDAHIVTPNELQKA